MLNKKAPKSIWQETANQKCKSKAERKRIGAAIRGLCRGREHPDRNMLMIEQNKNFVQYRGAVFRRREKLRRFALCRRCRSFSHCTRQKSTAIHREVTAKSFSAKIQDDKPFCASPAQSLSVFSVSHKVQHAQNLFSIGADANAGLQHRIACDPARFSFLS